jgi:hypothetical protein
MPSPRLVIDYDAIIAQIQANGVATPLPYVDVEVGSTPANLVGDLFDIDVRQDGRTAKVRVVDPSALRLAIGQERENAPATVKRNLTTFLRALNEQLPQAEARHQRNANLDLIGLVDPNYAYTAHSTISGPLRGTALKDMVIAYNFANRVLENNDIQVSRERRGSDSFRTTITIDPPYRGKALTVTTRLRLSENFTFDLVSSLDNNYEAPTAIRTLISSYQSEGHTGRVSSTTQVTGVQAEDEAAGCDLVDYFFSKATVDLKFAIEARVTELRNLGYDVVVQGLTFNGDIAA